MTERGEKRTGEAVRFYCADKKFNTSFTRTYNLESYMEVIQLNDRTHKCDRCFSELGHKGSLTKLSRAMHHKMIHLTCLYCSPRFLESRNLNKLKGGEHMPLTTTQSGSSNRSGVNQSDQNASAAKSKRAF